MCPKEKEFKINCSLGENEIRELKTMTSNKLVYSGRFDFPDFGASTLGSAFAQLLLQPWVGPSNMFTGSRVSGSMSACGISWLLMVKTVVSPHFCVPLSHFPSVKYHGRVQGHFWDLSKDELEIHVYNNPTV